MTHGVATLVQRLEGMTQLLTQTDERNVTQRSTARAMGAPGERNLLPAKQARYDVFPYVFTTGKFENSFTRTVSLRSIDL